jgi:two-component system heavy metal sensor histidine kinase CusS
LRLLLWVSALAALSLAVLAGSLAIRKGLAPLARLASRLDGMDSQRLDARLPTEDLPRELRPAVLRLNELLGRLEASFQRERQFSADVSHELRTPLAGLRTLFEVATSRDRPATAYKATLEEGLRIVLQTHTLVENLLALAHLEAHQDGVATEEINLRTLVTECFGPFATKADARGLSFENLVPDDLTIGSDREKLRIVLNNLLANAVEYTEERGHVIVESDASSAQIFAVCDSGPTIPDAVLARIFDRFFRSDPSRAKTGEHTGIGLALARALCQVLSLAIVAENRRDGWVAFRVLKLAK